MIIEYALGICHLTDLVKGGTTETALQLFQRVAENGYAPAQHRLAILYEHGIAGVLEPDIIEAIRWYKAAVDQGYTPAELPLAFIYIYVLSKGDESLIRITNLTWEGEIVPLLQEAARRGDGIAQYQLAICYKDGIGLEKNQDKMLDLLLQSAAQNYRPAQCALGQYHQEQYFNSLPPSYFLQRRLTFSPDLESVGLIHIPRKERSLEATEWYRQALEHRHILTSDSRIQRHFLETGEREAIEKAATMFQKLSKVSQKSYHQRHVGLTQLLGFFVHANTQTVLDYTSDLEDAMAAKTFSDNTADFARGLTGALVSFLTG
ncbi:MAG: sel1 repeat [Gammaproteobacteria bacterium]|nr:sel1 repeat [Gammaproteobacteria bacterium]